MLRQLQDVRAPRERAQQDATAASGLDLTAFVLHVTLTYLGQVGANQKTHTRTVTLLPILTRTHIHSHSYPHALTHF